MYISGFLLLNKVFQRHWFYKPNTHLSVDTKSKAKMSDRPPLEAFLEWKLKVESPSLAYAAKAATRNVIFAVDIPYPLLKAWHDFITSQKKERAPNNAQNTDGGEGPSSSSSS